MLAKNVTIIVTFFEERLTFTPDIFCPSFPKFQFDYIKSGEMEIRNERLTIKKVKGKMSAEQKFQN